LRRIAELLRNRPGTSGGLPLAATLRDLGEILETIGQSEEAVSAYREGLAILRRVVEDVPDHESHRIKLGEMYRRLGHALQRKKEFEEALSCFEQALEAVPDNYLSHQSMAGFLINAGDLSFRDFDRAVQHAARAVELQPRSERSHRLLGWARYHQQDWSGAIESLTKALELGFRIDARIGLQLAVCYAHLNEHKQGAEWYTTGVAILDKEEKQASLWLTKLREEAEELLEIPTPQTVRN
jgi:tetratricopeptide (TPR) repeat protein